MPRLSKIGAAALAAFGWTSGGASVTASYLVVAGGGGGGFDTNGAAGGGGAGGYLASTASLSLSTSYTITVGAGGNGATSAGSGVQGSNSLIGTLVNGSTGAVGGGYGNSRGNGGTGGSGGGGGDGTNGTAWTGGSATSGQGNVGGNTLLTSQGGCGGGGAGAAGSADSLTNVGGNGGVGLASSISGSSVYYAGGGGGGSYSGGTPGTGGNGGGGNGNSTTNTSTAGTSNTGGGGGGGSAASGVNVGYGKNGGSGIVIISYAAPQKFGGGVVTTNGSNIVHTFTTSGILTPLASLTASYLIVAGGGGATGGFGAGGGAGGLLSGSSLTIDTNSIYNIVVGSGGAGSGGGTTGTATNGSVSSFSIVSTTAVGGGGGGENQAGATGGSAGGNANTNASATSGTSGQGNAGGTSSTSLVAGGGGGGAGAVGATAGGNLAFQLAGNGGVGLTSSILPYSNAQSISVGQVVSTSVYYSGGGGGGNYVSGGNTGSPGTGGSGGGGSGSNSGVGTSGTSNTGGGGGGGAYVVGPGHYTGGNGGSGVVIISYSGSTQLMAGGQVIISGGNVIHVFTSSGSLTPLKSINNSLRFRASNSAYLSRTPSGAGSSTSFTYSFWVKRGTLGIQQNFYHSGGTNSSGFIGFNADNTLSCMVFNSPSANYIWNSTMVFRDPSAWYNIVIKGFASSSGNSYGGVELALYVNNVQQTFTGTPYGSPTTTNRLTDATAKQIGADTTNALYYDGYLADIYYIDGQSLTPSSFGATNSYGVWQPTYYGGSYGTNGFYLPFSNTTSLTTIGYDFSPNGNNWTTSGISLTAGTTYDAMTDSPTLSASASNYAVLNPNWSTSGNSTLSNANLTATVLGDGTVSQSGSIAPTSGQFYWEVTVNTVTTNSSYIGVTRANIQPSTITISSNPSGAYFSSGYTAIDGTYVAQGTANWGSVGVTYVIGIALNLTAGTMALYVGNTLNFTLTLPSNTYGWAPACGWNSSSGTGTFNFNFGQQPFTYTPPSGFVALNAYNLSTPTIPNGRQYMDATLWNGGQTSPFNVYNAGSFQPDFVWAKERSSAGSSRLYDVIRGTGVSLSSNSAGAEGTETNPGVSSFNSNGFTITNTYSPSVAPYLNDTSQTYVGWNWKANGSGSSNTNGSITSTVSASTTSGFSIVTYIGNGTAGATIGHGLGAVPQMVIVKDRTSALNWRVYHVSVGNVNTLLLNTTAASSALSSWNSTTPSSTVVTLGTDQGVNFSSDAYVAYCFAPIAGFSAFGSYTGNGSATGPFIYTGFQPKFVMIKTSSAVDDWTILDSRRNPYNTTDEILKPNLSDATYVFAIENFLSNGFRLVSTGSLTNSNGATYIYAAFASNPFKYTNAF